MVCISEYRELIDHGFSFCGVSQEAFAINGTRYRWPPGSLLSWSLAFDRLGKLGEMDLKQANEWCFEQISSVCNLDFKYNPNPKTANIAVSLARLDGKSGTLADMQIPVGNVSVNSTQLRGRIDIAEDWDIFDGPGGGRIDYRRVQLHEHLHAMGLGHRPDSDKRPALIAPSYSDRIWNLQEADVEELQVRHGAREKKPKDSESNSPSIIGATITTSLLRWLPSGNIQCAMSAIVEGKKYAANGELKPV